MKTKLLTAAAIVLAAVGLTGAANFTTVDAGHGHGAWATTDKGSVATIYADENQGAVLGFYRDQFKKKGPVAGCDFAIAADRDGVRIQLIDNDGKLSVFPVTDLVKIGRHERDLKELRAAVAKLTNAAAKGAAAACECECGCQPEQAKAVRHRGRPANLTSRPGDYDPAEVVIPAGD